MLIVKNHQNQSPLNLKTIFSRVLSRVKQTIASIKLLIDIGKQGRRTVDNQSRSDLQPFYYVLIKTTALNATCQNQQTRPVYKHDTCIDRLSRSNVMTLITIDNFRSQRSAPFNDFDYFAFNFNDQNFYSVNRFLKTLTVNRLFGRLTG